MEKPERSCVILSALNLDDVESSVLEAYHPNGSPVRPPRKPMGIFKALIVKRIQQVRAAENCANDCGAILT
jgi:hypothetical protein